MSPVKKYPLLQRFFSKVFEIGYIAGRIRPKSRVWLTWVVRGVVTLLSLWLPFTLNLERFNSFSWWPYSLPFKMSAVLVLVIAALLVMVLNFFLVNGLIPLLYFVPQCLTMKSIGLVFVSLDENTSHKLFSEALKEHKHGEKVRVLCISGRHLFVEQSMPNGKPSILHDLAVNGELDVLMPISDQNNPTVKQRFVTYTEDYKKANAISDISTFIDEIDKGKKFIRGYKDNVLTEHNILCMWRVILLSRYCFVQNYFPNNADAKYQHSFMAPTFVYQKDETASGNCVCYYDTFSNLFEFIKKYANEASVTTASA